MKFVQPSIDPVIISLGFIDIRWYSLAYIFGLIFGLILIKKLNTIKGNRLEVNILDSYFIWAITGIIIGGRLGYVLFYQLELFLQNPIYIFEIWNGGMSFHGGLIGIVFSMFVFSKKNKIDLFYLSDLISVAAPIGLFFGRIANFINTELIGRPTNFFISVIYPSVDNLTRHPSQLYEAFFEGILLFFILITFFLIKKDSNNYGVVSGLFLTLYSFFRFIVEFLREPDSHLGLFFNLITLGQILCIPMFFLGIYMIRYNGYKRRN